MKKAAEALCISDPKLIHVICVAHALHRVCETIQFLYPNMDRLLLNGKKMFVKSPMRIYHLKNKNPNLPLSPALIGTCCGTWLSAVLYYADNFGSVKSVVDKFDEDDTSTVEIFQNLLKDRSIRNELAYISANLSFLCNPKINSKKQQTLD